jgi:PAS domain S-box-containing protein
MADSTPDMYSSSGTDTDAAACLRARAPRPGRHDAAVESAALAALAQHLADGAPDLLQRLADLACALCGADAVVIALRGHDSDGADVLHWCGVSGTLAAHHGVRWALSDCPCGAPLLADDSVLLDDTGDFSSMRAAGLRPAEMLGVPWRVQGRTLGSVAAVLDAGSGRCFDADDLRLLHGCAAFAAAAHRAGAMRAVSADGVEVERQVEARLRPVLESNEHLEREVATHRAAERMLREHQALVDATLSIGTVGVLYFDLDGTVRDANAAFVRMTGYTCAELRTLSGWSEIDAPAFRDVTVRALRELAQGGATAPHMKQMVRKDGSCWWGLFAPARISGSGPQARCVLFVIDVSENKATEARLAESEERFRALVEGLAEAVWETDAHGRLVNGSASWSAWTGQQEAASLGFGWIEAVHPEDRVQTLREWRAAIGTRGMLNIEFRVQVAAGGWRWTNARAAPLYGDDGALRKWVGMHIDIDERRRTQALLADSERRHRMLFEAMDEGFLLARVVTDADGRTTGLDYVEANPAAVRMANIVYVGPGLLRVRPEHDPCWLAACAQVVQTGISCRSQCYAPALSSWFDFFVYPVAGRDGPRVAILFHDITVRKRAEDALRESEGRFRALADAAPALVYQLDVDGNAIYLNERCVAEATGSQEPGGTGWRTIARPCDMGAYLDEVYDDIRMRTYNRRTHAQVGDGSWHWFESHAAPWYSGDGAHRGYIGIALDITDAVQAEEALKQADRRKDEFLATLAHELRNPLAPISNAVHLMRRPDGRRQADRVIEMVGRQVRQIVRLVDDLMEVSRITRGKIDLKLERVPLADIVVSAVEMSQPGIERARHLLKVTLPDPPLVLDADRARLIQVFTNLLNNAAKYMDSGGCIWLDVRREGDQAVVSVRDSGIGIPAEELPRIFDMFAQVHLATGRGQGGLGIGLTMVRSLVDMHHGTVDVRSAGVDQGSEFTVRLPLAAGGVDALPAPAPPERVPAPLGGQRVLVVDDNRDAADTLGLLLEADGAEVRVVYDGRAALAMAESFMPHSVLLDIGMPGMDGYEVARRLRQDPRFARLRIVALTGWGQDADRRQTRSRGFAHHLTKPVSLEDLHRILA